ncbi:hypothetical protein CKO41_05180 [Thiococcus pfennigii]|nr:hypothetical protein [Thiococcus pfennigii]
MGRPGPVIVLAAAQAEGALKAARDGAGRFGPVPRRSRLLGTLPIISSIIRIPTSQRIMCARS